VTVEGLVDFLRYLNAALFLALGFVSYQRWRRAGGEVAGYAALTFTVLAVVFILVLVTPVDASGTLWDWVTKLTIAVLVLFPFFLYRFTVSMIGPSGLDRAATVATAVILLWTLFLPPGLGSAVDGRPLSLQLYLYGLIVFWTFLTAVAATGLWRAGSGRPGVTRRRMRFMSIGATLLNLALVIGVTGSMQEAAGVDVITQLAALGSAVTFFVAFLPPGPLRLAWRQEEEQAFQEGIRDLAAAGTPTQVASRLLPSIAQIVGAREAKLFDTEGVVTASYMGPAEHPAEGPEEELEFPLSSGRLTMRASRFAPFFGGEEVRLAKFLAGLMDLALERSRLEAVTSLVLQSAGEGIYGLDASGNITFMNRSAVQMLGWEQDEILGQRMHDISHHSKPDGSPYPREECPIYAALDSGAVERRDNEVFWRKNGSSFAVDYITTPIIEGGNVSGAVVVFADISERKIAERAQAEAYERERQARFELERVNQELESFVYTVSHDLNTPLISIVGFLEFFQTDYRDAIPEDGKFYLDRMYSSARYMQALIRDLLELSRVGRVQTTEEVVDLQAIISEVAEQVRSANPRLEVEVGDLPSVSMNPLRGRQLFANLLQNAARYAGSQPKVTVTSLSSSNGEVEISVADNGPGIPPEFREKIFGVFERLSPRETDTEGTGIGLAICKRIVESHGGRIWVEDVPEGTDMRILLPKAV
jgi:PAS domain S-box-containing protein